MFISAKTASYIDLRDTQISLLLIRFSFAKLLLIGFSFAKFLRNFCGRKGKVLLSLRYIFTLKNSTLSDYSQTSFRAKLCYSAFFNSVFRNFAEHILIKSLIKGVNYTFVIYYYCYFLHIIVMLKKRTVHALRQKSSSILPTKLWNRQVVFFECMCLSLENNY